MGSTSKEDKTNQDGLSGNEDVNKKYIKKVKQGELKGLLSAVIADELKVSSCPPSPASFTLEGRKPAEIFRTDLISAMKLPDQQNLSPENYITITDQWRQEWERGVQVPVNPEGVFQPSFRPVEPTYKRSSSFKLPSKLVTSASKQRGWPSSKCPYNLGRMDVEWLAVLNRTRRNKGLMEIEESTLEHAIAYIENKCYDNMAHAIATQEGLSIEYDEDICCDVCQSPDCEELNEMVFCDSCDICVHQACYGIQNIPPGSWLCHPCRKGIKSPSCALCSLSGSAMKKAKNGRSWVHVSCALWIPEVGFGDVSKMEPITRMENIPASRWNLVCSLCREKVGACIQCTVKSCVTAFHVTCGFKHGLEMRTVLDDSAADGVRHISYCVKHSHKIKSPSKKHEEQNKSSSSEDAENLRQKRLKQMEEDFHKYVSVAEISKDLNLPKELATRIHKYWTLKRKAQDDIPLLPPTLQQQEKLSGKQGAVNSTNNLQIQLERVVKLRCNLEKLRNLCYMVTKREKMRRELYRAREEVFWKEHEILTEHSRDMRVEEVNKVLIMCKDNFIGDSTLPPCDFSISSCLPRVCRALNSSCASSEDVSNTENQAGGKSEGEIETKSGGVRDKRDKQDSGRETPLSSENTQDVLPPMRKRKGISRSGQDSSCPEPIPSDGECQMEVKGTDDGEVSSPNRKRNKSVSEDRKIRTKSRSISEEGAVIPQRMLRSTPARGAITGEREEKSRTRKNRQRSLENVDDTMKGEYEESLSQFDGAQCLLSAAPRDEPSRTLRAGKLPRRLDRSGSGNHQESVQKPEVDEKESLKENDPLRPEVSRVQLRRASVGTGRHDAKALKRKRSNSTEATMNGGSRSKQPRITELVRPRSQIREEGGAPPKSPRPGTGRLRKNTQQVGDSDDKTAISLDANSKCVRPPKTFSNGREVADSSACPSCRLQYDKHTKRCLCGKETNGAAEWSKRELRVRGLQPPKSRARCSHAVSSKPHSCTSLMTKFCHASVS